MRAGVLRDTDGIPARAGGSFLPTLKGRLFLEDQKAILRSRTRVGRLKAGWPMFSGFILAFLGWGLGLLTPMIQQRLYPNYRTQNGNKSPADLAPQAAARPKPLPPSIGPVVPVPSKQ